MLRPRLQLLFNMIISIALMTGAKILSMQSSLWLFLAAEILMGLSMSCLMLTACTRPSAIYAPAPYPPLFLMLREIAFFMCIGAVRHLLSGETPPVLLVLEGLALFQLVFLLMAFLSSLLLDFLFKNVESEIPGKILLPLISVVSVIMTFVLVRKLGGSVIWVTVALFAVIAFAVTED